MAKWQQWRRADPDRVEDTNRGERLRPDMPFPAPVRERFFFGNLLHNPVRGVPFVVRSQHETGDIAALTGPGAPLAPRLAGKAIWTTLIPVVIFAALAAFADYAG